MAGIRQQLGVLICLSVAVMACWLCTVQASHHEGLKPDQLLTTFLLQPVGSKERSATLVPAAPGFPEESSFGQTQVFDSPVFLQPDASNGVKIASYQGFLVYTSTTESSITITAAIIFTDNSDYPAGTRLHVRGSFEPDLLFEGGSADLSIVGGTGPLLLATGYATYRLEAGVGSPGELFFRLILSVFLPGSRLYLK